MAKPIGNPLGIPLAPATSNPKFPAVAASGTTTFPFVAQQLPADASQPFYGSPSFSSITSGENTQATMVVGPGASITVACPGEGSPPTTGIIEATELATDTCVPVVTNISSPQHAGQLLISQPDNASAVWADPYVQGVFPPGTDVDDANPGSPPTPINPVLIGGENPEHLLENLNVDESGNLLVNDGLTFTDYGSPATQSANVYVVNPVDVIAELEPISSGADVPDLVPVSTSSVEVLAANPSRKGCNLVNMSYSTVSIAFGSDPAVLYYGIVLGPGGTFWMDLQDFTTASINAIASDDEGNLAIQEFE